MELKIKDFLVNKMKTFSSTIFINNINLKIFYNEELNMLSFKDFICENYDSFIIDAFSAEMKSKMSSKILHEIARN